MARVDSTQTLVAGDGANSESDSTTDSSTAAAPKRWSLKSSLSKKKESLLDDQDTEGDSGVQPVVNREGHALSASVFVETAKSAEAAAADAESATSKRSAQSPKALPLSNLDEKLESGSASTVQHTTPTEETMSPAANGAILPEIQRAARSETPRC